jgi:hypothetical protein
VVQPWSWLEGAGLEEPVWRSGRGARLTLLLELGQEVVAGAGQPLEPAEAKKATEDTIELVAGI